MPKTSTCPICEEPITLVEAGEASLVECPHCQSQFELAEALDFVAESDEDDGPPEVSLIELRETEESTDALTEEESSETEPSEEGLDEGDSTEEAPEDPPIQVRCPCCRDSFALEDLLLAETDEPLGSEAASAILADASVREPEDGTEGMRLNFGGGPDTAEDHSEFRLESVEERPTTSAGAFEFAAAVGVDTDQADSPESSRARRRRRERGGAKDLLGAIFGGAAGLFITYYLLNLFGGARFDMLMVYLPGVRHTAVHRPGWLGGPPEEEEFDSGIGDAVGMGDETPKPSPKRRKPTGNQKKDDAPTLEEPTDDTANVPPPPEEDPPPLDYVGLMYPPHVTSEQLGQALREVDRLAKAGPLSEEGYEAWCQVAEAATFVERYDDDPRRTSNLLDATRRLMRDLTGDDVVKIGQFATRRTLNPDRTGHGILLAGTARKPNMQKGAGYVTGMVVADTGAEVVIASDRKLPIQPEDQILLLGYLVDRPEEAIQGLDTELPQITWARHVVKFGE